MNGRGPVLRGRGDFETNVAHRGVGVVQTWAVGCCPARRATGGCEIRTMGTERPVGNNSSDERLGKGLRLQDLFPTVFGCAPYFNKD
jgi:hypothetical protein